MLAFTTNFRTLAWDLCRNLSSTLPLAPRQVVLTDVVWRVFDENEHVAFVRQRLGREAMEELTLGQYGVSPGKGLIIPRCYFLDQGTIRYKSVRVSVAGYDFETQAAVSAALDVPLRYHQQRGSSTCHLPTARGGRLPATTGRRCTRPTR